MTTEQSLILRALADFVNERKTVYEGEIDIESLYSIGKKQEVCGILYHQLQTNTSVRNSLLLRSYVFSLKRYHNRMALLSKIDAEFNEHKIPYVIMKGSEIAALYPVPALRTMGDSDVIVHPEDKERAHLIFEELGLVRECEGPNEWIYRCDGMEFELHHRMMNDEVANYDSHKAFMNRHWQYAKAEDGKCQHHFEWNFHFVFLVMHLRKHFIDSGVGFRQFMDLAIVAKKCELDWHWIEKELKKMDILGFAEICMTLCESWFGVSVPLGIELDAKFVEDATERIFANGVFGFTDENKDNYQVLRINKTGKVKTVLGNFFPSYTDLRQNEKYKFVDNKPYLLPAAWAYRAARAIGEGKAKKQIKTAAQPLAVSNKRIDERNRFLEEWKLK